MQLILLAPCFLQAHKYADSNSKSLIAYRSVDPGFWTKICITLQTQYLHIIFRYLSNHISQNNTQIY